MRFASYVLPNGASTWGAESDDLLFDLGVTGAGVADSLKQAIALGRLDALPDLAGLAGIGVDDVEFLPVIPDPVKILCIGVNYREHQEETGFEAPPAPTVFTRFADSQMGHAQPAVRPATTTEFDYEGEMALVIGAPAFRISEEDAWGVIAGYAPYNDFSVRDWQLAASQWTPGKNFPSTGAFGPYFSRAADIPDVTQLVVETRVNGVLRQSAPVGKLIFTIPQLIAHVSHFTPLAPGDVIVTGTPGGVGYFSDPQTLIHGGDVVEVEITGFGILRNEVVQELA